MVLSWRTVVCCCIVSGVGGDAALAREEARQAVKEAKEAVTKAEAKYDAERHKKIQDNVEIQLLAGRLERMEVKLAEWEKTLRDCEHVHVLVFVAFV